MSPGIVIAVEFEVSPVLEPQTHATDWNYRPGHPDKITGPILITAFIFSCKVYKYTSNRYLEILKNIKSVSQLRVDYQ
jgi:hypothetical protein